MNGYLSQREALLRAAAPGLDSARRLARLTDAMLRDLAGRTAPVLHRKERWALIALGGYGAGALLPASDLDLLLLSNAPTRALRPFAESLLYPLWDAGLTVGHQVRTPSEHVRAARTDIATLTASLTGRVVAGDDCLGTETLEECAAGAAKRRSSLLRTLHARPRPGSPYLLEPDLKEGAGGRRDSDELTWTAAIFSGIPQADASTLVSLGLLTTEELDVAARASATVAAARWQLQRTGSGDRMTLDAAASLDGDAAAVQQALIDTQKTLLLVRRRALGAGDALKHSYDASTVLELLQAGLDTLPLLEELAASGALEPFAPGLKDLMAVRRPGRSHELTVGAHCLKTTALAAQIVRGTDGKTALDRSAETIADPRPLVVATLVHDFGKTKPGPDHARRGALTATDTATRLGVPQHAEEIASLVRLHLVLPEAAGREDLDDEDAVLRLASQIADRALLAPLHVLTAADSMATGPSTWNDWNAVLVAKLVARLDVALSSETRGAGLLDRAERVREQAAPLAHPGSAREFIRTAPARYLCDRDPHEVARDAALVASLDSDRTPGAHALAVSPGPTPGSDRVSIATRDRSGLLATIAGTFALSGLDILGAEAVTSTAGIALDTFTVRPATLVDADPSLWAKFERLLDAALRDRLAVGVRLAERRRRYRSPSTGAIELRIREETFATVLTVRTPDRIGLLYDVARAIAESGLDIRSVVATTHGGLAEDTFRVVDAGGEAAQDPGLLGQLRMRLRDLEPCDQ